MNLSAFIACFSFCIRVNGLAPITPAEWPFCVGTHASDDHAMDADLDGKITLKDFAWWSNEASANPWSFVE